MLPATDPHVERELSRLQDMKQTNNTNDGYSLEKPMQIARKAGIPWGSFPPSELLNESQWFQTLSKQQKDTLCFSMVRQPKEYLFRDCRPSFGRTRVSAILPNGKHMAGTCVPSQLLMMFPASALEDAGHTEQPSLGDADLTNPLPRFVLGRESLALQGFPIDIIPHMGGMGGASEFSENTLTDLAGNMVSTTVFLALLSSTIAAVSWLPLRGDDNAGLAHAQDCMHADNHDSQMPNIDEQIHACVDGLLHGGPSGPAVAENPKATKRWGGLLDRTYTKRQKTLDL